MKQNSPPEISSPLFLEQNSGNSQQDVITRAGILENYWKMSQNVSRQVFFLPDSKQRSKATRAEASNL